MSDPKETHSGMTSIAPILSPEAVISLIRKIICSEIPTELPSFDFEGPNIIKTLLLKNGTLPRSERDILIEADHFADAMGALEFVKLASGTVAALLQIIQLWRKMSTRQPDEKEMIKTWRLKLIKAGLQEERATRIASMFYRDALNATTVK